MFAALVPRRSHTNARASFGRSSEHHFPSPASQPPPSDRLSAVPDAPCVRPHRPFRARRRIGCLTRRPRRRPPQASPPSPEPSPHRRLISVRTLLSWSNVCQARAITLANLGVSRHLPPRVGPSRGVRHADCLDKPARRNMKSRRVCVRTSGRRTNGIALIMRQNSMSPAGPCNSAAVRHMEEVHTYIPGTEAFYR